MDPHDEEDLTIWNTSRTYSETRRSVWLFTTKTIIICEETEIVNIDVCARAHLELALFNLIYTFWKNFPFLVKDKIVGDEIQEMGNYHSCLHEKITAYLKRTKKFRQMTAPPFLQPWIRRTFCLFNHDHSSREAFKTIACPVQLLDSTVFDIVSRDRFQSYIQVFVHAMVGKEPFRWITATRPWHLDSLVKQTKSSENLSNTREKGIFFLPHEESEKTWTIYTDMPNLGRNFLVNSHFLRLLSNSWLDDEVINAYVNLMNLNYASEPGVYVGQCYHSYFVMKEQKDDDELARNFSKISTQRINAQSPGDATQFLYEKLIFPTNWADNHWLVVILTTHDKKITIIDSYSSHTGKDGRAYILKAFKERLHLPEDWSLQEIAAPQQPNTYDCGIYCCQFIKFVFLGKSIPNWHQEDMAQLRKMMTIELYEGSLRWFSD